MNDLVCFSRNTGHIAPFEHLLVPHVGSDEFGMLGSEGLDGPWICSPVLEGLRDHSVDRVHVQKLLAMILGDQSGSSVKRITINMVKRTTLSLRVESPGCSSPSGLQDRQNLNAILDVNL